MSHADPLTQVLTPCCNQKISRTSATLPDILITALTSLKLILVLSVIFYILLKIILTYQGENIHTKKEGNLTFNSMTFRKFTQQSQLHGPIASFLIHKHYARIS